MRLSASGSVRGMCATVLSTRYALPVSFLGQPRRIFLRRLPGSGGRRPRELHLDRAAPLQELPGPVFADVAILELAKIDRSLRNVRRFRVGGRRGGNHGEVR